MKKWMIGLGLMVILAGVALLPRFLGAIGFTLDPILGMDLNRNGVRDDVERYIDLKFGSNENQKKALLQLAGDYQAALANMHEDEKLSPILKNIQASWECAWKLLGEGNEDPVTRVEAEIFDNYERSLARLEIDSKLNELEVTRWDREEWLKGCRFEVKQ